MSQDEEGGREKKGDRERERENVQRQREQKRPDCTTDKGKRD